MKKKYVKPQITRVRLNPTQAVLTVCSTLTSSAKNGSTGSTCRGTGTKCKKHGFGGDSHGRC